MMFEKRQKYHHKFFAKNKADQEILPHPKCFDRCVSDLTDANLSSVEKNCVRDCFLKHSAAYDDLVIYAQQKNMFNKAKTLKAHLV